MARDITNALRDKIREGGGSARHAIDIKTAVKYLGSKSGGKTSKRTTNNEEDRSSEKY